MLRSNVVIRINLLARYLNKGAVVEVEPNGGLLDSVRNMDFLPGFSLEGYFLAN